ncbi:MAG: HD domain-containing protein [Symbiobacteriaceae bacterium]|nr:HD domain-containing protein [Symbiobacteriaceae bacterium]
MALAKGVYSLSSQALLSPGVTLTQKLIDLIKEVNLAAVIVEDDRLQGVLAQDFVREEVLFSSSQAIQDIYKQARSGVELDTARLRRIAYILVDEVLAVPVEEQMIAHQINRTMEGYLYEHLVQVAVMAVAIGRLRSYRMQQLRELALAALLIDIGTMVIGQEVVDSRRRFSTAEHDEMKRHCMLGYQLTRKYMAIPLLSAAAVLQHSERENGSGYPQGLKGEDIHEYARILAVCDTFDALITDRTYRRRYLTQQAIGILNAGINQTYDEETVIAFSKIVVPYPVGTVVELNTRDTAIVVGVNRENKSRPVIRLLLDRRRFLIDGVMEIDLQEAPDITIVKTVEDISVPVMWRSLLF